MKKFIKKIIVNNIIFKFLYIGYLKKTKNIFKRNSNLFKQKSGLEIGGPSSLFTEGNPLPFYEIIKSLDNVNFSSRNFWSEIEGGSNFFYSQKKPPGEQIISDAVNLKKIDNEKYEFILSSHVLEHIANPIKAIFEWKRVLKKNGVVLIVIPNMLYTYDRKRPLTTFDHILNDYLNDTQEDDNTHLSEIIKLHDLSKDSTVSSYEEHCRRTLDNHNTRISHHHTFDKKLLLDILNYCGFTCLDYDEFKPYHIVAVATKL